MAMMPVAKAASLYFGIVAHPSSDRPHEKPTALLGGLAVMVAFVAAIGFVGIVSGLPYHSIPWLTGFAVAMCLVGLLDDIVDLRPRNKLLLELAAICILVWWGPHLDFFPYDPLNIALTIFWLVTATNAFNLIDGIDGLAAGVGNCRGLEYRGGRRTASARRHDDRGARACRSAGGIHDIQLSAGFRLHGR